MTRALTRFMPLHVRAASAVLRRRFTAAITAGPQNHRQLFERFESLGDGCEFAALQRAHGIERPALFNWRDTHIEMLVQALQNGLEGFDRLDNLSVDLEISSIENVPEYMIINRALGTRAHTFFLQTECSAQQVLEHEHRSLVLLKRKFLSDVASARRIYVYHATQPITQESAEDLARALRQCGDNTLLWAVAEDDVHMAGEAVQLCPSLYRGYVTPTRVEDYGDREKGSSWLLMLQNALDLMNDGVNKAIEIEL